MIRLRPAVMNDVPLILDFIRQLAEFEREPDAVKMTEPQLHDALFGDRPRAEALIAEDLAGPLGFAIWFETFNTWTGKAALYLEDVFVMPGARGFGTGSKIFKYLANLAVERGHARMEWSVLNWNVSAIRFYESFGAQAQSGWTRYRLSGAALNALATGG